MFYDFCGLCRGSEKREIVLGRENLCKGQFEEAFRGQREPTGAKLKTKRLLSNRAMDIALFESLADRTSQPLR